jgi:hypothetical protein
MPSKVGWLLLCTLPPGGRGSRAGYDPAPEHACPEFSSEMILRPMAGGLHRIEIFVEGEVIGVKKVARMGRCGRFWVFVYQRNLFPRQKKAA